MNNRTGVVHPDLHHHSQQHGRRSVATTSTTTTRDDILVSSYTNRDLIQASIMASFTRKLPHIRPSSSTSIDRVSMMRHHSSDALSENSAPLYESPVPTRSTEGTYVIRSHIVPSIPTNLYQRHKILYHNHYPRSTTLPFPHHFQNSSVQPPRTSTTTKKVVKDDNNDERFIIRSKRSHDEINSLDTTDKTFDKTKSILPVIQEDSCMMVSNVPPMMESTMTTTKALKSEIPKVSSTSTIDAEPRDFDKTGIIGAYNIRRGATTIEKILNDPCVQANKVAYDRVLELVESMRRDADVMEAELSLDTRFERGLKALLDFKTKHGHFRLPAKHTRHKFLSKWMRDVRRAYWEKMNMAKSGYNSQNDLHNLHLSHTSGHEMQHLTELEKNELATKIQFRTMLTQRHIHFLAKMGFVWEPSKIILTPKTWEERFEELKRFKKERGHCNVPQKYASNPSLGNWVHSQRKEFEKRRTTGVATITEEQIKKLNSVEFVWKLRFGRPKKKNGDTSSDDKQQGDDVLSTTTSITNANRIPSISCCNSLKTTDDCGGGGDIKTAEAIYRPRKKSQKTNGKSSHQHHDKMPTAA